MLNWQKAYLTHACRPDKPEMMPNHGYTLRGISSSPDVFYLCVRAESDCVRAESDSMEIDEGENSAPKDQWWKLGYVAEDEPQIKAEMTTYEKAVEEACGFGSKPLLIYASESALSQTPIELSDALKTFVRFDNRFFKQELAQATTQENDKKRGGFATPASPSKRRARSASFDSVATNAASAGSLDELRGQEFYNNNDNDNDDMNFTEEMPDLIDMSVPDAQSPQRVTSHETINGHQSPALEPSSDPAASAHRLTNVSLDEIVSRGLAQRGERPPVPPRPVKSWPQNNNKPSASSPPPAVEHHEFSAESVPEMQERGGTTSPFFANHNNNTKSVPNHDNMDIDDVASPTVADAPESGFRG